jgi:Superfamily I DNA and RNA helicases
VGRAEHGGVGQAAHAHVRGRRARARLRRLTLDGTPRPLYVGRRWVHDEHESLVVNWQAPAARPFYTATPETPHGVQQRRRFRAEGGA